MFAEHSMYNLDDAPIGKAANMPSPLIEGWMPPTRQNWQTVLTIWQIAFPVVRHHPKHHPNHGCFR